MSRVVRTGDAEVSIEDVNPLQVLDTIEDTMKRDNEMREDGKRR